MKASIIISGYTMDRSEDLIETIDSVLNQTYDDFEIVAVLEDTKLVDLVEEEISDERINTVYIEDSVRISEARNIGAENADGNIIVYVDDDIIAEDNWLEKIMEIYESRDDIFGVGGRADPIWPNDTEPRHLPPEFYWLVGVTHTHHPDRGFARNTFGCNISFKRKPFLEIGGMNEDLGKNHGTNIQGEETDVSYRLQKHTGDRFYYTPDAVINHKVYPEQLYIAELLNRAFWQGYTKQVMERFDSEAINEETSYLNKILSESIPRKIRRSLLLKNPSTNIIQTIMILVLTGLVGFGYVYGKIGNLI